MSVSPGVKSPWCPTHLHLTLSLSICFQPLQLTREYFTKELKRHYQGYNNTVVFTSTWNAIMTTVRLSAKSF